MKSEKVHCKDCGTAQFLSFFQDGRCQECAKFYTVPPGSTVLNMETGEVYQVPGEWFT